MKLKLSYPLRPFRITQKFGENSAYYKANVVDANGNPIIIGHNGLDLAAVHGQPVYAAHDGYAYPGVDDREGYGVVIRTDQPYEYKDGEAYFKTIYWHLVKGAYRASGKVSRGQLIGYADNTGLSTGDHTHFGFKPQAHNEDNGSWLNLEQNNGYAGAIDPMPYFDEQENLAFTKTLLLGDRNDEVAKLQDILRMQGYFPVTQKSTGYYGVLTRRGVAMIQKFWNLGFTGGVVVGPKTRAVLNRLWSNYY